MTVLEPAQAAELVRDGTTVATGGFGCCGHPEAVTRALAERFARTGSPRGLTLLFASGQGDRSEAGLNRLARPGLVKRAIGGYWDYVPRLAALALSGQIDGYNWPQGVISRLFRAKAAGQPAYVTRIGLGTFIDPARDGGRIGPGRGAQLLERVRAGGAEAIAYPALPVDVTVLRASAADARGNLVLDGEASYADSFALAAAAHNSGGIVIAQVRRIAEWGEFAPHAVCVPGCLVDYVTVVDGPDADQTYAESFNPAYVSRGDAASLLDAPPSAGARAIVVERALHEFLASPRGIINFGIGMPSEVGRRIGALPRHDATVTLESGAIGGRPAGFGSFGATAYPEAIVDAAEMFDLYDGGGIDQTFLGFGEMDGRGRINVARFVSRMPGVGGFVNISQSAKKVTFCGTYTAVGLDVAVANGKVVVRREGSLRKFVDAVDPVCFDPSYARTADGSFTVVTERCVLEWRDNRLVVTEVAPGIDVRTQIAPFLPEAVAIAPHPRAMPLPPDTVAVERERIAPAARETAEALA
ncbi:MAG: propionate CoA-transferase [Candidatus Eremiobacteraeota bacterium]|nr:propionate CoA-transferase [Candidatus Eremiobacteraeota bacterium]